MLDFCIDESYTSGGEVLETTGGVFVLAGWVTRPEDWDCFERMWQADVIAKAPRPITRLHMSELEHPIDEKRGEFRGWTRNEQNRLMDSALTVLTDEDRCPSMFGMAEAIDVVKGRKYTLEGLFTTALYHLVMDFFQFSHVPVEGLQLGYEDDNRQLLPLLQTAMANIKGAFGLLGLSAEKIFNESGYQPMKVTRAGLQVADLLAYEIKRRVERRPKPRRSYQRIIDGRWHVFRRSIADVDGALPILGLPSHTFDPVSRGFIFRDREYPA